MDWYYAKDGKAVGPVDGDRLRAWVRARRLNPDDLVWNASMGQTWTRVADVPELAIRDASFPPAVSVTRRDAPPVARISLTEPLRDAWTGTGKILFAPFDLGKWFVLGFTAWLATLGESGGGFGGSGQGRVGSAGGGPSRDVLALMSRATAFVSEHAWLFLMAAGLAVVMALALLWLRSRGKFMLLDNVVRNRAEVVAPWKDYARLGDSLFLWSAGFWAVCLAAIALWMGAAWPWVLGPSIKAGTLAPVSTGSLLGLAVSGVMLGLIIFYITRFLEDFVAPLMYQQHEGALRAWRRFGALLAGQGWSFVTYGLFYLLLQLCAGGLLLLLMVLTCCLAGCLMAIPYLGAVLLLPVTVFFRLYSLAYLAQFGAAYTVTADPAPQP